MQRPATISFNAQRPSVLSIAFTGSAPRPPVAPAQKSHSGYVDPTTYRSHGRRPRVPGSPPRRRAAAAMSIAQQTEAAPVGGGPRGSPRRQRPSEVLREVLPRIERSDKLAVAVELESRVAAAKEPLADPAFRGL